MKKLIITSILAVASLTVQATCTRGYGDVEICNGQAINFRQQLESEQQPQTQFTEQTFEVGDTTYRIGRTSDGRRWSTTTNEFNGTEYTTGVFDGANCGPYGCN